MEIDYYFKCDKCGEEVESYEQSSTKILYLDRKCQTSLTVDYGVSEEAELLQNLCAWIRARHWVLKEREEVT
jgi:hypothetical protein